MYKYKLIINLYENYPKIYYFDSLHECIEKAKNDEDMIEFYVFDYDTKEIIFCSDYSIKDFI